MGETLEKLEENIEDAYHMMETGSAPEKYQLKEIAM